MADHNQGMKEYIEALASGSKMPIDGEDGLVSISIGLAAKKSVVENRPVKILEIIEQPGVSLRGSEITEPSLDVFLH